MYFQDSTNAKSQTSNYNSSERFSKEDLKTFANEKFSDENFTKEKFTKEKFTNEKYAKENFANENFSSTLPRTKPLHFSEPPPPPQNGAKRSTSRAIFHEREIINEKIYYL